MIRMEPETGDSITRRPRRSHQSGFKAKVALAAIRGEQTLVELCQQLDVTRQSDQSVEDQLLEEEKGVFGNEAYPPVDLKSLHAKIGEPTL
ncbi:hypothetical protein GOC23_32810 [Sinorhizobium meliloti]|nr:hypothetical protein [Sinorhizobium meliloti]